MSKNKCSRKKKRKNVNSVINFRRVTHFWLCLFETQVPHIALFELPEECFHLVTASLSAKHETLPAVHF